MTSSSGVPIWMISPSFMMAMRSASRIASSKSWVMKTMVFLQHALQPQELVLHLAADQRIERRERLVEEPDLRLDREDAGDADALLLAAGQFARIEALAAARGRPARSSRARAPRASARSMPWIDSGKATFSSTVRCGSSAKCWNTMPILWRRISISSRVARLQQIACRRRSTSPAVGSISRDRQRTSVDLPEPDRPMMTKISPSRTSSVDVAHGADQLGLRRGRPELASPLAPAQELVGARAEELPDDCGRRA